MLDKKFSRRHTEIFFLFSQKTGFDISCKLSPLGDNLHEMSKPVFWKKINLSSAEFAQKVVKVKVPVIIAADGILIYIYLLFLWENKVSHFMWKADYSHEMSSLIFLEKKKYNRMPSATALNDTLWVKLNVLKMGNNDGLYLRFMDAPQGK